MEELAKKYCRWKFGCGGRRGNIETRIVVLTLAGWLEFIAFGMPYLDPLSE
jgi:hypothetical protein